MTCAAPLFKREYFAGTTLTGTPRRTDRDGAVDEHWTGAADVTFAYAPAPRATAAVDKVKPLAPASEGATGYRVYRRADTSSAWTPVDTTDASATTGSDRTASVGRSFYYLVALDAEGAEGPPSATAEAVRDRPVLTAALSAPKLTVVQGVRIGVTVDAKPGDADRGKGITGYEWSFSCANGVWKRSVGETVRVQEHVSASGPRTLRVRAVGHYGSTGDTAYREFFRSR